MPRTTNPYTMVIKHLVNLQAKADKHNTEIASFTMFVEAETKGRTTPASPVKKAVTPKVTTKAKKFSGKKSVGNPAVQPSRTKMIAESKTPVKDSHPQKPAKAAKKTSVQVKKELTEGDGNTNYLPMLNQDSSIEPVANKSKKK